MSRPRQPVPKMRSPWTERLSPMRAERRNAILTAWESLPRPRDLVSPRSYLRGRKLQRALFPAYTMLYPLRGRNLYRVARHADRDHVPGALVDCGTWNGGSTALLSAGSQWRDVWAFDSFEGLPPHTERDVGRPLKLNEEALFAGMARGSETLLREAVAAHGNPEGLRVRKGWFEDTLPLARDEIGSIAVLHCDGDWYESVSTVLRLLYPLVSAGGWVVIDDYGAVPGAHMAVDEFRGGLHDPGRLRRIDQTGRYWRKPGPPARA